MIYKIYFQIYDKRLKATIKAKSESEAKEIIKNKIIFDKIIMTSDLLPDEDETLNNLKSIFKI